MQIIFEEPDSLAFALSRQTIAFDYEITER